MPSCLSPSVLTWLRSFEATARLGSFTLAADELCITQSAVSQQVKRLEHWLDRPLLLRTPRSLMLTSDGQFLSTVVNEAFTPIEHTLQQMRQPQHNEPIALSCSPSFAMCWLTPRLNDFFQTQKGVGLRVHGDYQNMDRTRMFRDGIDAAVRYDLGNDSDLYCREILDEWLVPVASPSYLAAHPELRDNPTALHGKHLLHDTMPWDGAPPYAEWRLWLAHAGVHIDDWDSGKTYNLSMLAQGAAIAGHGVAMGRLATVSDELQAGRLQPLSTRCVRSEAAYHFMCIGTESPRVAVIENWLTQQAAAFRATRNAHVALQLCH